MPTLVRSTSTWIEVRIDLIGAEARNAVILNAAARPEVAAGQVRAAEAEHVQAYRASDRRWSRHRRRRCRAPFRT